MTWSVEFHREFAAEFASLSEPVQNELAARVELLKLFGPGLARPSVDTLKGTKLPNLKELRFAAEGGVWRAAFAFDADRIAVLLVAGNKRGKPEARFYKTLIATAERRWATWIEGVR